MKLLYLSHIKRVYRAVYAKPTMCGIKIFSYIWGNIITIKCKYVIWLRENYTEVKVTRC